MQRCGALAFHLIGPGLDRINIEICVWQWHVCMASSVGHGLHWGHQLGSLASTKCQRCHELRRGDVTHGTLAVLILRPPSASSSIPTRRLRSCTRLQDAPSRWACRGLRASTAHGGGTLLDPYAIMSSPRRQRRGSGRCERSL